MIFDFLNILALVTIFAGVIALVDIIWRRVKGIKKKPGKKLQYPMLIDYARSFFPVLLAVLIIRSFLFQAYRVPTGSLEPTVMPGDLILVNQYDYGLRLPIWDTVFVDIGHPKTGQVALFHWPVNPEATFVKRVIGVPGDHISYVNKVLYINGKKMSQKFVKDTVEVEDGGKTTPAKQYEENLNGTRHYILVRDDRPTQNFKNLTVPEGQYFMMGDNRDDSDDGRSWGFVPERYLIGRASMVLFNFTLNPFHIGWDRIGDKLYIPSENSAASAS